MNIDPISVKEWLVFGYPFDGNILGANDKISWGQSSFYSGHPLLYISHDTPEVSFGNVCQDSDDPGLVLSIDLDRTFSLGN